MNFLLPASSIALESIRSATFWKEFVLKVNNTYEISPTYTVDSSVNPPVTTLSFLKSFAKTDLGTAWNPTTKTISNIQLVEGGQPVLAFDSVLVNDMGILTGVIPNPAPVVFSLAVNTSNGLAATLTSGAASYTSLIPTASSSLYLEGIYYSKSGTGTLATLSADVADVPAPMATFSLVFNTLISGATSNWTVEVTNVDKGSSYTLTNSGDAGIFQVNQSDSATRSTLTIGILGTIGKQLSPNTRYKVTLNSSSIARADIPSTSTQVVFGTVTRYFATGSSQ